MMVVTVKCIPDRPGGGRGRRFRNAVFSAFFLFARLWCRRSCRRRRCRARSREFVSTVLPSQIGPF